MKIGDVVAAKHIRVEFSNEKVSGSLGYRAPKGERFVFVFLGVETDEKPLDPSAVFDAMGWEPRKVPA